MWSIWIRLYCIAVAAFAFRWWMAPSTLRMIALLSMPLWQSMPMANDEMRWWMNGMERRERLKKTLNVYNSIDWRRIREDKMIKIGKWQRFGQVTQPISIHSGRCVCLCVVLCTTMPFWDVAAAAAAASGKHRKQIQIRTRCLHCTGWSTLDNKNKY